MLCANLTIAHFEKTCELLGSQKLVYQIRCKNSLTVTSSANWFADLIKFHEMVL